MTVESVLITIAGFLVVGLLSIVGGMGKYIWDENKKKQEEEDSKIIKQINEIIKVLEGLRGDQIENKAAMSKLRESVENIKIERDKTTGEVKILSMEVKGLVSDFTEHKEEFRKVKGFLENLIKEHNANICAFLREQQR